MAERVDSLPRNGAGRRAKYPWDEWMDGSIWKLTRGVDFNGATKGFRNMARVHAYRHNLALVTRVEGDFVYLQATPKDPS